MGWLETGCTHRRSLHGLVRVRLGQRRPYRSSQRSPHGSSERGHRPDGVVVILRPRRKARQRNRGPDNAAAHDLDVVRVVLRRQSRRALDRGGAGVQARHVVRGVAVEEAEEGAVGGGAGGVRRGHFVLVPGLTWFAC